MSFEAGPVSKPQAARNRLDFVRLAHAIEAGEFDGMEIMFLGFNNDPQAQSEQSLTSATEAANQLLAAFRNFAPDAANRPDITFLTNGFGIAGSAGCSDENKLSTANFIEIWVRPAA